MAWETRAPKVVKRAAYFILEVGTKRMTELIEGKRKE
jgi:hypothetical protein